MVGLNDDLDLVIIGGYYGTGKRSGVLSHFLLAVALDEQHSTTNKSNQDDELDFFEDDDKKEIICRPENFYSFCKIGSGYTYKELKDFNVKLADKWNTFDKKNPPKHIQFGYQVPDVWIEPKDSFIVQVKAVEITKTDKYKTGLTLRFPRLEKFRHDKPWYECMKFSELTDLFKKNEGKLASGKLLIN